MENGTGKLVALIIGLAVGVVGFSMLIKSPETQAQSSSGSFSFAAVGDIGANSQASDVLNTLGNDSAKFALILGDLDYDQSSSDAAWCNYVKDRVGNSYPFQLVTGNHEQQGGPDGNIMNHAKCLPDRMNSKGKYPADYYFDYPSNNPNLRVIMISPDLRVDGTTYTYNNGNSHMDRLLNRIDDAKANGQWVVVGMHKNCITTGAKSCEIGRDLFNQLISKKVDLILQGHDHNYQRSKQLAHGSGCSAVSAGAYDADCVADSGSDGQYSRGRGPIVVISGLGGKSNYPVRSGDRENGYFARKFSSGGGYLKVSVSSDSLDARYVRASGSGSDNFSITGSPAAARGSNITPVSNPAPSPAPNPQPRNTSPVSNPAPPAYTSPVPVSQPPAPTANTGGNGNILDLFSMLRNWESTGAGLEGDLNNDNMVNVLDLSMFLSTQVNR